VTASGHHLLRDWCLALGLATFAVMAAVGADLFWRLDNGVYDELSALHQEPVRDDIVIVAIDDESLRRLGAFPWPRELHARLMEQLREAAPKAVLYDILFVDPRDGDARLAQAAQGLRPVIPDYVEVPGRDGSDATVVEPLASLRAAGALVGHASLSPDRDGIARRAWLLEGVDGRLRRHVAWIAVCRAAGSDCGEALAAKETGFVRKEPFLIPFPRAGQTFRRVPFAAAVDGEVPASFFHDRIVLVGATAAGLGDTYATPLAPRTALLSGVEINAGIVQALLDGRAIVPAPEWSRYLFALMPLWLMIAGFLLDRPLRIFAIVVALGLAVAAVSTTLWLGGIWLSPVAALAGLGVTYPLWAVRRLQVDATFMREELERFQRDAADSSVPAHRGVELAGAGIERLRGAIARSRNLQRFLADTLDGLPDASLVVDPDGIIRMANARAQTLLGDMEGEGFSAALARLSAESPPSGRIVPGDASLPRELVDPSGRIFDLRWSRIRRRDGQAVAWVLRLADVSDLRLAMRQREEALQLLTHDMRSPQVSILTLLGGIKESLDSDAAARIGAYARRTLALADGFVQLARAEAGEPARHLLNFSDVVLDAVDDLWPQSQARWIAVGTEGCDEEFSVIGDRMLLTRAVVNLVGNAIKYSPSGSSVRCKVHMAADNVVLEVCDDGPGIGPDEMAGLFEPFRRGADHGCEGVGLGLAFVRSVARRHRGTIACASRLGEGACFKLTIPRADEGTN